MGIANTQLPIIPWCGGSWWTTLHSTTMYGLGHQEVVASDVKPRRRRGPRGKRKPQNERILSDLDLWIQMGDGEAPAGNELKVKRSQIWIQMSLQIGDPEGNDEPRQFQICCRKTNCFHSSGCILVWPRLKNQNAEQEWSRGIEFSDLKLKNQIRESH